METTFINGTINGLQIKKLKLFKDNRGWLSEIFRKDQLAINIMPVMSYVSLTKPKVKRGPHEHLDQTDYFSFLAMGKFLFMAWDNRKESPSFKNRVSLIVGKDNPTTIIVPPRIVHGYVNIGNHEGIVFNCPNKLFAGHNKKEEIDEIRHEDDNKSPFVTDFEMHIKGAPSD